MRKEVALIELNKLENEFNNTDIYKRYDEIDNLVAELELEMEQIEKSIPFKFNIETRYLINNVEKSDNRMKNIKSQELIDSVRTHIRSKPF